MRARSSFTLALVSSLAFACGGGGDDDGDDDGGDDDDQGPTVDATAGSFDVVTTDIVIAPNDERTHCYYTTLPLARAVGISRWASTMAQGSHHMIVYALASSSEPDGTVVEDCNVLGAGGFSLPAWIYASQTPEAEAVMPAGIGLSLGAQQKVVIEMHYLNPTPDPITAHVELHGEYYDAGEEFEPAATFVTYDQSISIPAESSGMAGDACAVPAGSKFFTLSTHAHKRATLTRVSDQGEMVFESTDWEHPGGRVWTEEPFYEFTGSLEYHCEYDNPAAVTVVDGPSAETNEMCMAVGYFFPATEPVFCIDGTTLP
jgi:hypothetical protein